MKSLHRFIGVICLLSCQVLFAENAKVTSYKAAGKEVMNAIVANKVDAAQLKPKLLQMASDALALADQYVGKFPEGKKMFDMVKANFEKMKSASFEELEKDWHDLGYFAKNSPGVDLKQEKNEHFTDPLHCIVHPLMTLKAAEKKDLQAMKEELSEGLEQMDLMAKKL